MPQLLRISTDINKDPIEFLTLGEIAKLCDRSTEAFKKLIARGILPDANYRTPRVTIGRGEREGTKVAGYRLYSKEFLAPKLVKFFTDRKLIIIPATKNKRATRKYVYKVSRGKLITIDQRAELLQMFQEERNHFSNY